MSCLKAETMRDALACFLKAAIEDATPVLFEPDPAVVFVMLSAEGFKVQLENIESVYSARSWERNRSLTQEDFENLITELFADEGSETGSAPAVDGGTSTMNDPALDHAGSDLPMQAGGSLSDHGSGYAVPSDTTTAVPVPNDFHRQCICPGRKRRWGRLVSTDAVCQVHAQS